MFCIVIFSFTVNAYAQNITHISLPKKEHPIIESRLNKIVEENKIKPLSEVQEFAVQKNITIQDNDRIRLVIETDESSVKMVSEQVELLGGKVETTYKELVQILVPISLIEKLANIPEIRFIRFPYEFYPQILGEGVGVIGANSWKSAGYLGGGVKIAILDGGFQGYAGCQIP